jgi:hypothetical protein
LSQKSIDKSGGSSSLTFPFRPPEAFSSSLTKIGQLDILGAILQGTSQRIDIRLRGDQFVQVNQHSGDDRLGGEK